MCFTLRQLLQTWWKHSFEMLIFHSFSVFRPVFEIRLRTLQFCQNFESFFVWDLIFCLKGFFDNCCWWYILLIITTKKSIDLCQQYLTNHVLCGQIIVWPHYSIRVALQVWCNIWSFFSFKFFSQDKFNKRDLLH